jgi:hypothetical protein
MRTSGHYFHFYCNTAPKAYARYILIKEFYLFCKANSFLNHPLGSYNLLIRSIHLKNDPSVKAMQKLAENQIVINVTLSQRQVFMGDIKMLPGNMKTLGILF